MPRRVAIAVLEPPVWAPPGVEATAWRVALAEDTLDVLALMTEVEPALAVGEADASLARELGWPGLRTYVLPALDVRSVFAAAAADGYDHAVALATDAPDLPGMVIAKLLRPLTSKPVAAAAATGTDALIGLATRLPAPGWIPARTLDALTPMTLRGQAPSITDVAPAAAWHRLRTPADLARLDPRLEGWDATRSLLTQGRAPS